MASNPNPGKENEEQRLRWVLLVAMPLSPTYDKWLKKLGVDTTSTAPQIDWETTDSSEFPRIHKHLSFALHMAICVIDPSAWTDRGLTLREKLQVGLFWDHNGWDGISTSGNLPRQRQSWGVDMVCKIQSVELIGATDASDAGVDEVFSNLMSSWVYGPVWWNCQDFAIRLACLLSKIPPLDLLRDLLRSLRVLFKRKIIDYRERRMYALARLGIYGCPAFTVMANLFPPFQAVAVAGFLGGMVSVAVVGVADAVFYSKDISFNSRWRANLRELGEKFPVLRELHEGLGDGLYC